MNASAGRSARAFTVGVIILGIGCAPPPNGPAGALANGEGEFPWPTSLATATDAPCAEPERRVREGLALQDDVGLATICIISRLAPPEVDAFTERVRQFRARDRFKKVRVADLPEGLRADVASEEPAVEEVFVLVTPRGAHLVAGDHNHTELGSGSVRGVCLPWSRKGHSDATEQAIKLLPPKYAFSPAAVLIVEDAAQDPDLFEWSNMAAHAQTRDANGRPSPDDAKTAFVDWFQGYVARARAACTRGQASDAREALYWFGYSLHALEDLAPHRGRTNPEHAYDAHHGENPDADPAAYTLAVDLAYRGALALLDGPLDSCRGAFATYAGPPILYREKLGPPFSRKLDMTPVAILKYRESANAFALVRSDPSTTIRWFGGASLPTSCSADEGCANLLQRAVAIQ